MGVSFTYTKDSQNSRGSEESILISLYQFHLHTKIKTFIYIYGFEMLRVRLHETRSELKPVSWISSKRALTSCF